jgi:hypothetical protein
MLTEKQVTDNNVTGNWAKDSLSVFLQENICKVLFTKVDGTKRDMTCTLRSDLLPDKYISLQEESSTTRPVNVNVLPVFDVDKREWRSFRVDSIIRVIPEVQ